VSEQDRSQRLLTLARELEQVLEQEFQSLQQQQLESFDRLQPAKSDLLDELSRLCPSADELQQDPAWSALRESLLRGRDAHRRNSILIERKLEAIRGALSSLQIENPTASVEVYDRLGKVSRFNKGRGFQDA
jgi:flagellar biosynthesis/type III secretory pathway chaperone